LGVGPGRGRPGAREHAAEGNKEVAKQMTKVGNVRISRSSQFDIRLYILLIRGIGQNQCLRVTTSEERRKWDCATLIHPVDANRSIIHVRGCF
jgi:hypothetical protein